MKQNQFCIKLLSALLFVASTVCARAQWSTESFPLQPGWNAVYLNVDSSYDSLDNIVGADNSNPITQVWLWQPSQATAQFVSDPQQPTTGNSQWLSWVRSIGPLSKLRSLVGNQAYMVYVPTDGLPYTWKLKGKPVPPQYLWKSTGLNLIGFPSVPTNPATFDTYLAPAPQLEASLASSPNAGIYAYVGGALGFNNPQQVFTLSAQPVNRGQAFWVRTGGFNSYFGPFNVLLSSSSGINFGDKLSQFSFRLQNQTASPLTVNLSSVRSEPAPASQPPVRGETPLLLRGSLNLTNLTYGFTTLNGATNRITLQPQGQPGSDVEVVVGLNRSVLTNAPGDLLAGILRLTDATGLEQVDVPVSAQMVSNAGLWVGTAVVGVVNQYLNSYYTAATLRDMTNILTQLNLSNSPTVSYMLETNTSRIIVLTTTNGTYLPKQTDTSPAGVARPFSLRLIVHSGTNGLNTLLQRVYVGPAVSNQQIVAVRQSLLDPNQLSSARRISCTHLPWEPEDQNLGYASHAPLLRGSSVSFTVFLPHDDQRSNPFLHTYHPDHDNLSADYSAALKPGIESYSIRRLITLYINPPKNDFASLTAAGSTLAGNYSETMILEGDPTINQSRTFTSGGNFQLNRISNIATLTQ